MTGFEKFLFQLKTLQKWMQKDVNRFFVAQAVPEINGKKERLKNCGDVFFLLSTVYSLLTSKLNTFSF